ncbi:MAG TPA: hypothetical protein DCX22_01425, partial [Dehalococcoidia bacterium]|nr:hypothetical protein [Dehalococcoidia bacterium]
EPLWILKAPRRSVAEHDPALAPWLQIDDEKSCFDELCILYVALTRARRGLYMVTSYPGKSASMLNHAAFLKRQLSGDIKPVEGQRFALCGKEYICLYRTGEQNWYKNVPAKAEEPLPPVPGLPAQFRIPAEGQRPAGVIPSAQEEGEIPASSLFAASHRENIELGNAVHQLFEKVTWSDSFDVEQCIRSWRKTTRLAPDTVEQAIRQFTRAIESPNIALALRRPEGAVELWRERSFEVVVEKQWISGAFDRVIITKNGDGSMAHATIMDFKTNEVANDLEIAVAAERYRTQLALYRKALSRILKLNQARIAVKLLFTQPCRVFEL